MKSEYIRVNGLMLHYLAWGDENGSTPVIFLHGLASNARIWQLMAPLFPPSFSLFAIDQRGHGRSDKPESAYSTDEFVADLHCFIDAVGIKAPILIGHSWGASIALEYAARTQSGSEAPQALFLVDGGVTQLNTLPGATWEDVRIRLTPPRLAGTPIGTIKAMLQSHHSGLGLPEESISISLANFWVDENNLASPNLSFDHHMKIVRSIWEFSTFERFGQIQCPAYVILARPQGPDDTSYQYFEMKKTGVAQLLEQVPDLEVVWMDNTIHDIPLQRPGELTGIILNFLGK